MNTQLLNAAFISNLHTTDESNFLGPKISLIDRTIDASTDLIAPDDREWPSKINHDRFDGENVGVVDSSVESEKDDNEDKVSIHIPETAQKQLRDISTSVNIRTPPEIKISNFLSTQITELEKKLSEERRINQDELERMKLLENDATKNKSKIENLICENAILHSKSEKLAESLTSSTTKLSELKELNERIEILIKENDALVSHNQTCSKELDHFKSLFSQKSKDLQISQQNFESAQSHISKLEQELHIIADESRKTQHELSNSVLEIDKVSTENQSLNGQLKSSLNENKNLREKICELKRNMEEISDRYQAHVRESVQIVEREKELLSTIKNLEFDISERKLIQISLAKENETLKEENVQLLKISQNMEQRINKFEDERVENFKEIQVNVEKAENALLERDKALLREEQGLQEIKRLDEKMKDISKKIREKTDAEIFTAQTQFQKGRRKLLDDVEKLESSNSTLQAQIERAIREKRSAENELEKLTRHLPVETERMENILEELNMKLKDSERMKHDAMERLESLNQKSLREQNRLEKEKEQLSCKYEETYRRLRRIERELEEAKEDKLKLITQNTEIDRTNRNLIEAKTKLVSQQEAELTSLTQRYEGQIADLSSKLEHVSEAHSRTCRELQQLLSEQRRTSEKWKEESKQISTHYDSIITELKLNLSKSQRKIESLEETTSKLSAQRTDAIQQVTEEKKNLQRLHSLLQNSEARAEASKKQIQMLLVKENEWNSDKKHLQREIDQLTLEKERIERQRIFQTKQDSERGKFTTLYSTAPAAESDTTDRDEEVENLKAEIERVKQRSHSRNYQIPVFESDNESDIYSNEK